MSNFTLDYTTIIDDFKIRFCEKKIVIAKAINLNIKNVRSQFLNPLDPTDIPANSSKEHTFLH